MGGTMSSQTSRDACVHGFLELVGEMPFERVTLEAVGQRAGVGLGEMRVAFATPKDLLAAAFRHVDREVLAQGGPEDFAGEPPKERLFEVLMRRLDALEPHRAAIASLTRSARRDPLLATELLRLAAASQRWMLACAGLEATGLGGAARAHGLAVLFARVVAVWLDDEDPGLSRTMAKLDRELTEGGKLLGMVDDLLYIALPWRKRRPDAPPPRRAPWRRGQDADASPEEGPRAG